MLIMYYVYILNCFDKKIYTGFTSNLRQRYQQHCDGKVQSTKNRRPLKLVYYQAFLSKTDALKEEKYLKSGGRAKTTLKAKINNSLNL